MAGKIEARLAELGVTLPEASVPQANYVPYTISGISEVCRGARLRRLKASPCLRAGRALTSARRGRAGPPPYVRVDVRRRD